jgi:release factor glutamine methyltransferase
LNDAQQLVLHATGWSHTQMVVNGALPLPPEAASVLAAAVARRERREPLQLIVGSVGFRYLDIEVRAGVFIPRPETEVLVEAALSRIPSGGTVVEPCTGAGAVACAIAAESAAVRVLATDISPAAVELASHNARRNCLDVEVRQGDLLGPVPALLRGTVDVIVCNPPYLTSRDMDSVEPEVRWDPTPALVSGATGHEVTDRLIGEAARWLRPGGWLLLEVDGSRAGEMASRASSRGLEDATTLTDLNGVERVVVARRPVEPR